MKNACPFPNICVDNRDTTRVRCFLLPIHTYWMIDAPPRTFMLTREEKWFEGSESEVPIQRLIIGETDGI